MISGVGSVRLFVVGDLIAVRASCRQDTNGSHLNPGSALCGLDRPSSDRRGVGRLGLARPPIPSGVSTDTDEVPTALPWCRYFADLPSTVLCRSTLNSHEALGDLRHVAVTNLRLGSGSGGDPGGPVTRTMISAMVVEGARPSLPHTGVPGSVEADSVGQTLLSLSRNEPNAPALRADADRKTEGILRGSATTLSQSHHRQPEPPAHARTTPLTRIFAQGGPDCELADANRPPKVAPRWMPR